MIDIENVSKIYQLGDQEVRALDSVSLHISKGEMMAIMGPSGSGKSTLMAILVCLDVPTSGSYKLDGESVENLSENQLADVCSRKIGFVFQQFNLLSRTSALDNVMLPLTYAGVSGRDRKRLATEALQKVGLGDRLHHRPNELSGGQQQRVAIARALVTSPPLLLADEPTVNLDTRTSLEVLGLLQALNRGSGITICLVTHEPDIAACASRVINMRDGRVRTDVYNQAPVDAHAALAELPPVDEGPPEAQA
jgi:putative ABC transport system ATP-binding protein